RQLEAPRRVRRRRLVIDETAAVASGQGPGHARVPPADAVVGLGVPDLRAVVVPDVEAAGGGVRQGPPGRAGGAEGPWRAAGRARAGWAAAPRAEALPVLRRSSRPGRAAARCRCPAPAEPPRRPGTQPFRPTRRPVPQGGGSNEGSASSFPRGA